MCGAPFEPNPEKVRLWAESGDNFDGTDWTCPACVALDDVGQDDEPEPQEDPPCHLCGYSFEPDPSSSDLRPDCVACLGMYGDDKPRKGTL